MNSTAALMFALVINASLLILAGGDVQQDRADGRGGTRARPSPAPARSWERR